MTENTLQVEEINLEDLSKETESAIANYDIGESVKEEPKETIPAIALVVKDQKIAGKYVDFVDNSEKKKDGRQISNMHVFELPKTGKKIGVWGTTVLDSKLRGAEIGASYLIICLGKPEEKNYYDYDVKTITPK